ncbi:MAG: uracil-DNA glycosylase family protein [Kordiimonadaceae bacterium]|nr:uracil-DNA glycosylase family protein [Kordiimonadaceae bacterium]
MEKLLKDIRACTLCENALSHGVRPVVQISAQAQILIAGQAPGSKVHATGIPFDDPSGHRLRDWMGISKTIFYDPEKIAILPMGFCYPGKGKSGDLPPRAECAPAWRDQLLGQLPTLKLTLVIGQYALKWHMPDAEEPNLTETVRNWRAYMDRGLLPLPHPSPRNNIWLKKNQWFEAEVVPALRGVIDSALG